MIKVVCGIIFNKDNQILVTRRMKGEFSGQWEFPGGKIEEGETYEECLCRELEEELSIKVTIYSQYMVYQYSYPSFSMKLISLICRYEKGEIKLREHDKFSWVMPTNFKNYDFVAGDIKLADRIAREGVTLS